MRVERWEGPLAGGDADTAVVGLYEEEGLTEEAEQLDAAAGGLLRDLREVAAFSARANQVAVLFVKGESPLRRLVVVGLGPRSRCGAEQVRQAAGSALKAARERGARRVVVGRLGDGAPGLARADAVAAAVEGAILGLYRFQEFKSEREEREVEEVRVVASPGEADAVERAQLFAEATNFARDLGNTPSNRMTPTILAERATEVGRARGLEVIVWGPEEMEREGMGALLGVARGSAEPPRLIMLRYRSGREGAPLLALAGKGITFDTGGLSLKPPEGMEEMKFDMAGGAAVIAAMQLVGHLRPAVDVLGIVAATENMPGGRAQKPGDVVRTCIGKTIEVINTDAEGRLVLADAVAYAAKQGANWIVDLATLTGAAIIALGHEAAALMGNDERLQEWLREAADRADERVWPLPTYDAYREQYKSEVADIKNIGGRPAGTITAGMIIGEFVGKTPWAHLDIAGVAWNLKREGPYTPKGASGYGVRTLAHLVERVAAESGGEG